MQKKDLFLNSFIFRLPQTIIRAFGIPRLPYLDYFQIPINNKNLDNSIEKKIYEVNSDLLSSISEKKITHITERNFPFNKNSLPTVVESNIVHLYHSKLKHIPTIYLIPYASSVFNPKFEDLRHLRGFLKCLKDSWYFNRLIPIAGVFDWASMILDDRAGAYIPWFWNRLDLDLNVYIERLRLAEIKLGKKSQFIDLIQNKRNPIIIQSVLGKERTSYLEVLDYYYQNNFELRKIVDENEVNFFIKPHRSDISFLQKQKTSKFRGHDIHFPNDFYDLLVPTELLLNIRNKPILVSEVSSTLFNSSISHKILISDSSTNKLLLDYGLMASRNMNLS